MTTALRLECPVHVRRRAHGAQQLCLGADPVEDGKCIPHLARLMALALHFETLVHSGAVKDYAALARQHRVTRARMSHVMNLINLAPEIQEALLFLPPATARRAAVVLTDVRPIAALHDWARQRRCWRRLRPPRTTESPA